jgi:hypothetical protein
MTSAGKERNRRFFFHNGMIAHEPDGCGNTDRDRQNKFPPGSGPSARLIGYRIIDVDNGYSTFELNPEEYHYNPFSTVHGEILSTLLDSAMTAPVLSTLAKGFGCATVEIKVNFIIFQSQTIKETLSINMVKLQTGGHNHERLD